MMYSTVLLSPHGWFLIFLRMLLLPLDELHGHQEFKRGIRKADKQASLQAMTQSYLEQKDRLFESTKCHPFKVNEKFTPRSLKRFHWSTCIPLQEYSEWMVRDKKNKIAEEQRMILEVPIWKSLVLSFFWFTLIHCKLSWITAAFGYRLIPLRVGFYPRLTSSKITSWRTSKRRWGFRVHVGSIFFFETLGPSCRLLGPKKKHKKKHKQKDINPNPIKTLLSTTILHLLMVKRCFQMISLDPPVRVDSKG